MPSACYVTVFIQQIDPRHANVVEHDTTVVDARQTTFVFTVRRRHARQVVAFVVADRHQKAMHPVVDLLAVLARDELCENRSDGGTFGGAADVVLACVRRRGVDDELLGVRVVGGDGLQRLYVATVTGLGHRETAAQLEIDDLRHVCLVVALGAQILDGSAEQAPLHTRLDHQRQIRHRQHLDRRDGGTDVAVAPVFFAETVGGCALGGHDAHLLGYLGASDHRVRCVMRAEEVFGKSLPHLVLHVAPASVQ